MTLHRIQTAVHVAKDKRNDFGGYNYRTAEGILAATKAALAEGETIGCTDDLREVAGQIFVEATATITLADGVKYSAKGFALHPLTKKGMDPSQITGAASSYARKYALAGLLALDDSSGDPDAAKKGYEPDNTEAIGLAVDALNDVDDVAALRAIFKDFPKDVRTAPAVVKAGKDRAAALEAAAKKTQAPADDLAGDDIPY